MGWCGGTNIFDYTMKSVLDQKMSDKAALNIAESLRDALQDEDWDNEGESEFYDHPVIGKVFNHDHDHDDD